MVNVNISSFYPNTGNTFYIWSIYCMVMKENWKISLYVLFKSFRSKASTFTYINLLKTYSFNKTGVLFEVIVRSTSLVIISIKFCKLIENENNFTYRTKHIGVNHNTLQ